MKWSKEEWEPVERDWAEGVLSIASLSRKYEIPRTTLTSHMKRGGLAYGAAAASIKRLTDAKLTRIDAEEGRKALISATSESRSKKRKGDRELSEDVKEAADADAASDRMVRLSLEDRQDVRELREIEDGLYKSLRKLLAKKNSKEDLNDVRQKVAAYSEFVDARKKRIELKRVVYKLNEPSGEENFINELLKLAGGGRIQVGSWKKGM